MDNLKTNLLYEEMMWDAGPMTYHIFFLLRGNLYTVQYTDLNCKVNELMNIYIYTHIYTHIELLFSEEFVPVNQK